MDELFAHMNKAIEKAIEYMMGWEISLKKELPNGDIIVIRSGVLDNIPLWFVALQTSIDKIPTEELAEDVWGEKVLASMIADDVGLVIWVYDDADEMMSELSVMFELFLAPRIEE